MEGYKVTNLIGIPTEVNDFDKPMPAAAFEKKLAEGRYS